MGVEDGALQRPQGAPTGGVRPGLRRRWPSAGAVGMKAAGIWDRLMRTRMSGAVGADRGDPPGEPISPHVRVSTLLTPLCQKRPDIVEREVLATDNPTIWSVIVNV